MLVDTSPRFDGRLSSWDEVQDAEEWDVLLLGNGLSINVWGNFEYGSLYEEAKARRLLSAEDAQLFERLRAANFEDALHALAESIRVGDALGDDRSHDIERHTSVQKALAAAVHSVHIGRGEIPDDTLERIKREMRLYRYVFTTSYDLILYWAVMHDDRFQGFLDFFWGESFDETTHTFTDIDSRTRLHFLHGALHLVVDRHGRTCKRKSTFLTLLDQFGSPYRGDSAARPLIVTEARAEEKERRIVENEYLSYCWRRLAHCGSPLVLFGHSLSAQDNHLVKALNRQPERPIAVSLLSRSKKKNAKEKHRIASLLETEAELYFFDAESHPLGSDDIRLKETEWRKLWRPRQQAA